LRFCTLFPSTARIAKVHISPRKLPSQSRSLATVQVILPAAARVLARESLAGFNTNRVAEVTGISVGSLYQYFPSKKALVTALSEPHQNELIDVVRAVAREHEEASLERKLAGLYRVVIEQQFSNAKHAAAIRCRVAR
jgi:AcrR family transcriptional regulator